MKTVLLSVLLWMLTMSKAQAVTSEMIFDLEKFAGLWYEVGMSTNSDVFLKQKGIKRLGATIVMPLGNIIRVKTIYDTWHECVKEDILGSPVDMPGKFAFSRTREAYVIDTDYKTYAIVNIYILDKGMNFNILKFFNRTLWNIDKGLKRLKEISESIGISRDNVFILVYDDTCVKMFKKVNPFGSLLINEPDDKRDTTCVVQDAGTIAIQHKCWAFDGKSFFFFLSFVPIYDKEQSIRRKCSNPENMEVFLGITLKNIWGHILLFRGFCGQ